MESGSLLQSLQLIQFFALFNTLPVFGLIFILIKFIFLINWTILFIELCFCFRCLIRFYSSFSGFSIRFTSCGSSDQSIPSFFLILSKLSDEAIIWANLLLKNILQFYAFFSPLSMLHHNSYFFI